MRPKAGRHRSAPSRGFTRQARHLTRRAASQLVLLEGRRHAVVAREGGRAPAAPAELLEAGRVGCEVAEVAVVRVAQAALVGRGRLAQVRLPVDVAWRGAVPRILVPDDEVVALATGDVVGAVPPRAEVEKRAASLVRVRGVELAVRRRARVAAHGQRGAAEVLAEADVDCDVGVIRVHVQAEVLPRLVLDHEGVVRREPALRLLGVQKRGQGVQHRRLQPVDRRPHPDGVDDDAVIVHRVWPLDGQPGGIVPVQLVQQQVAERAPSFCVEKERE
mmetsp:Transcript_23695/g.67918  ORF Transcript_23695/g.67918 Transcript_23695/m.67918 type:complete len:275 (-) Transcript_23695:104-928(-)